MRLPLPLPLLAAALAPAAAAQDFDPPVAPDLDPDPEVVEVELVAEETLWEYVPGVPTRVWAYNGTVPGPTIEANVGDLVRVRFRNELPEETTIHWHGVEVPAHMDGSHVSQRTVRPGEEFTYEFRTLRDGLYWYHPHVRPFDQVERGLHGAFLVRDAELEAALGLDVFEEHVVVFDDILLDANLEVVPAFSFEDPITKTLYQLNGREGNHLLINGKVAGTRSLTVRNGAVHRWRVLNAANTTFCRLDLNVDQRVPMLQIGTDSGLIDRPLVRTPVVPLEPVNPTRRPNPVGWGRGSEEEPETSTRRLPAPSGKPLKFTEIVERWEHSVPQDDFQGIFLMPGERMDVLFLPLAEDGETIRVFQFDWFRGRHSADVAPDGSIALGDLPSDGRLPAQFVMNLAVEGDRDRPVPTIPTKLRDLELLDPEDAIGTLAVHLGHSLPDPDGNLALFAQARFEPAPGGGTTMVPLPAPLVDSFEAQDVHAGETWIWEVHNLSHGDHPFHVHGFFFQPYELEYRDLDVALFNRTVQLPIRFPKDTVRVPARLGLRGRSRAILRAVVRFDDTGREGGVVAEGQHATYRPDGSWTSGGWLFHCHVLEHSAGGMLSFFELHDPEDPFRLLGKHLEGTGGRAHLTGGRPPKRPRPIELELVDALPNATVFLAVGRSAARVPLAGGTMVPEPEVLLRGHSDDRGHVTFRVKRWDELAPGTVLYAQAAFRDTGAVQGLAMSNALSVTLP